MWIKTKKLILNQIEDNLEKYNESKSTFTPLKKLGV